jgi:hypothetical protein
VAFRVAAGELKERGRVETFADEPVAGLPDPFVDLWRALAKLPLKQRASVVLADYAGLVAPGDREGFGFLRFGGGRARPSGEEASA